MQHLGAIGRFASLALRPLLGFLAAPQMVRFLSNVKCAALVLNHRCKLYDIIRSQFVATVQRIASTACMPV